MKIIIFLRYLSAELNGRVNFGSRIKWIIMINGVFSVDFLN